MNRTVVATLTDAGYYDRAKCTVRDIRSRGQWRGDLVVISVGFSLPETFRDFYDIIEVKFPRIDTDNLVHKIGKPFPGGDGREFSKLVQWEKLHVFDCFFQKWDRVIFVDAGMRILDSIQSFASLDCTGGFLAHHDNGAPGAPRRGNKPFGLQICIRDESVREDMVSFFPPGMCSSEDYFLNCAWIYDTRILDIFSKQDMIACMNRFPVWKSNEMGVMNAVIHFQHGLWKPFPFQDPTSGKILFEWSELTQDPPGTWRNYCMLKYPITISAHDT